MAEEELSGDDGISNDDGVGAQDIVREPDMGASLTEKEVERKRLQDEVEAFLASGGKINQIPANHVADPPKKPESNYGGQPI